MKNKLHDLVVTAQYHIIMFARKIKYGADNFGTFYYRKDNKVIRDEVSLTGMLEFGSYKHVAGSSRILYTKEEVPFEGY